MFNPFFAQSSTPCQGLFRNVTYSLKKGNEIAVFYSIRLLFFLCFHFILKILSGAEP